MFCKASTERAKENTVLVSEIFIVYFFVSNDRNIKWTMEFDKKFLVLTSWPNKISQQKITLVAMF